MPGKAQANKGLGGVTESRRGGEEADKGKTTWGMEREERGCGCEEPYRARTL